MPAITLSASYDMDSNIVVAMSYNNVEATFVKIYFENMDLSYLQRLSLEIFEANRHVVVEHSSSLKETSNKDIYHFDNGQLIREERYFQGRLHCESGPALYERGNVKHSPLYSIKRWRLNGEPYQSDDQPSEIWTTHNGKVKHRWENSRHDPNLPDSILYRPDGTIFSEEWLDHRGRQHREGGPASCYNISS